MLLTVVLMAVVARWARQAAGRAGAVLAVAVMAFDPTMVAHGQLATTDAGVALFSVASIYVAARARIGLPAVLAAGAMAGAAMAAKGSAVLVLPAVVALLAWHIWSAGAVGGRARAAQIVGAAAVACLAAFVTLWAAYGFRLESSPLGALHLPLVAHVRMVSLILGEKARTAFLMGEVRQGGWWWYFPFAFAVKTPLPLIALLGAAGLRLASRPRRALHAPELWVYPLLHTAVAMVSGMNIGLRHLLPAFPFGYVLVAGLVRPPRSTRLHHMLGPALTLLIAWQALEAAAAFPFGIAYFNQLVGGPANGYRVLVDSNADWGQSFKALASTMRDRGFDSVRLSYYTWIDPAVYGVKYEPLPPARSAEVTLGQPYDPEPGVYAISATPLQGVMVADPDLYSWFRQREPDAQPGYGLLVYHVERRVQEPAWVAQCTQPVTPLPREALVAGFGRDDLRKIAFDCTRGWLIPAAGKDAGWTVTHASTASDAFVERMIVRTGASLSYVHRQPDQLPPFSIYVQPAGARVPETQVPNPIPFGALTLVGYTLDTTSAEAGHAVEVDTWWRVEAPVDRPLSLMLHLGKPGAAPIAVGDGLAVPIAVWQVGDVLVQRHTLQIPEDAASGVYTMIAGAYWLDVMEQWSVVNGAEAGADSVALATVEIAGP